MANDYNDCEDKLISAGETIDLLRENLGELVNSQDAGLAYESDKMVLYCQFCLETGKFRAGLFPHSGDCPIVRGRKLVKI